MKVKSADYRVPQGKKLKLDEWPTLGKPFCASKRMENTADPQVKQLAEKCLPTLENHLRLAENLAGKDGMGPKKG